MNHGRVKIKTAKFWKSTQEKWSRAFSRTSIALGVSSNLYHRRHSGAPYDLLSRHRDLQGVKSRLWHRSDSSAKRYARAARVQKEVELLPKALQKCANDYVDKLPRVFLGTEDPVTVPFPWRKERLRTYSV